MQRKVTDLGQNPVLVNSVRFYYWLKQKRNLICLVCHFLLLWPQLHPLLDITATTACDQKLRNKTESFK